MPAERNKRRAPVPVLLLVGLVGVVGVGSALLATGALGRGTDADEAARSTTPRASEQEPAAPTLTGPGGLTDARAIDVRGSLHRELITRVVRSKRRAMRRCYEDGLKGHARLSGDITIRFTIAGDGTVGRASVESSAIGDDAVERCMLDLIERARFPPPQGAGMTIVEYPLTFAPQG